MCKILLLLFCFVVSALANAEWAGRGTLARHQEYTKSVLQELVTEIENLGFNNLRMLDSTGTINTTLYNLPVVGNVTYKNGFLVSIQEIDATDFVQMINTRTVDDQLVSFGTARGVLNFRDVKLGFDVEAVLEDSGVHTFTGTFVHNRVAFQIDVVKNLLSGEYSTSASLTNLGNESGMRMIYMPSSNISEALSRNYQAWGNWDGILAWARDIFAPIVLDIAKRKPFPEICFNYNC